MQRPLLTLSPQAPQQSAEALAQIILSQSGRQDRIAVQLDPPELGRINMEFIFDGRGLQNVHVIADSPEMQQFLKRHGHLLGQILSDSGLPEASISFDNRRGQENPQPAPASRFIGVGLQASDEPMAAGLLDTQILPTRTRLSVTERLDIRA